MVARRTLRLLWSAARFGSGLGVDYLRGGSCIRRLNVFSIEESEMDMNRTKVWRADRLTLLPGSSTSAQPMLQMTLVLSP